MGRVKELYFQEERIKLERAEAAFFALPEAQAEALSGIQQLMASHLQLVDQNSDLQAQLVALQEELRSANSPAAKWKERAFGFAFGVIASIVASLFWAQAIRQWPSLA